MGLQISKVTFLTWLLFWDHPEVFGDWWCVVRPEAGLENHVHSPCMWGRAASPMPQVMVRQRTKVELPHHTLKVRWKFCFCCQANMTQVSQIWSPTSTSWKQGWGGRHGESTVQTYMEQNTVHGHIKIRSCRLIRSFSLSETWFAAASVHLSEHKCCKACLMFRRFISESCLQTKSGSGKLQGTSQFAQISPRKVSTSSKCRLQSVHTFVFRWFEEVALFKGAQFLSDLNRATLFLVAVFRWLVWFLKSPRAPWSYFTKITGASLEWASTDAQPKLDHVLFYLQKIKVFLTGPGSRAPFVFYSRYIDTIDLCWQNFEDLFWPTSYEMGPNKSWSKKETNFFVASWW